MTTSFSPPEHQLRRLAEIAQRTAALTGSRAPEDPDKLRAIFRVVNDYLGSVGPALDTRALLISEGRSELGCQVLLERLGRLGLRSLTPDECRILSKLGVASLYSLQPVENLLTIQAAGIFSRNVMSEPPVTFSDFSDAGVQRKRSRRLINGRSVHDYVPLFFRYHTPMLYTLCVEKRLRRKIAVLEIDLRVLGLPGIQIADGNAASETTIILGGLETLERLDWKILSTYRAWSPEYRRAKAAEVLVPNLVPPEFIRRIHTADRVSVPASITIEVGREERMFPRPAR